MRVLTCLLHEHSLPLVALAAFVCVLGSSVFMRLAHRALTSEKLTQKQWWFLASMCAGSSIWATHFIAMLGYRPGVPVSFDAGLTILSAAIATIGTALSLIFASSPNRRIAILFGGSTLGLAIATMHYVGMFAYRADGIVHWSPGYVAVSIVIVSAGSAMALFYLRRAKDHLDQRKAVASLVAAIVGLHFTGMAAFAVTPIVGVSRGYDSEAFHAMAASIAVAAVLVLGMGVATSLVDKYNFQAHQRLQEIALRDHLTGLYNRHFFNITLLEKCQNLPHGTCPFALLMIDLDRFKTINDSLGHPMGDRLLQRVAHRLTKAARPGDIIARIGGDEFALILSDISDRHAAMRQGAWVVELLSRPFLIDGHVIQSGTSVGMALAPEHSQDAEALCTQVDIALYRAKFEGRGRLRIFDPAMLEEAKERSAIEADLRVACTREEFDVCFQPILNVHDNGFFGAEALVRWTCPGRGEVSPDVFIPIAEDLGLISQIGNLVLERACRAACAWPPHLKVAVNVSQVQIAAGWFVPSIARVLENTGLDPSRLEIEITETAIVGNDNSVLQCLNAVRALGVRISLDDFGTGYSSLSYLLRYPIDRIKIDRSFVSRLPQDANSASIVRAICQLAASLDLEITAEGVETEAQCHLVSLFGCTQLQGFLFGSPVSADAIGARFSFSDHARDVA